MDYINYYKKIYEISNDFSFELDDEKIIFNLMTNNIIYLLKESLNFINEGKSTFAFPVLRQVYEYSILQLSLDYSICTVREIVNANFKYLNFTLPEKLHNKMLAKNGKTKANQIKDIFKVIKNILNIHTHANIDRLLYYSSEVHMHQIGKEYLIEDAKLILHLLNIIFLSIAKVHYNIDIQIDDIDTVELVKKANQIKNIILPDNVIKRLINIESIKDKLGNKYNEFKEEMNEIKSITKD